MTLQRKTALLARLRRLLTTLDDIRMELEHELALGRELDRTSVILGGWSAELIGLLEDVAVEIENDKKFERRAQLPPELHGGLTD